MAYKCTLVDYFDVWGNPEEGYEVNNLSREDIFYMNDTFSDNDLIIKLIDIEYLKPSTMENFEILDEGCFIEFFEAGSHLPLFRIELEEITPIAGLTLTNWGGITILEINERDEEITVQLYNNDPITVQYDYEYNEEEDETEAFFLIGDTKYYFNEFMMV